jgi:hypothetical protein
MPSMAKSRERTVVALGRLAFLHAECDTWADASCPRNPGAAGVDSFGVQAAPKLRHPGGVDPRRGSGVWNDARRSPGASQNRLVRHPRGQDKYQSSRPSLPRSDVTRSTQATPAGFPQALNMAVAASV